MKRMRKMLAVVLAVMIALTMGMATTVMSFADETSAHTITITNTDQNVSHTYKGYQVFKGKLDASQKKLSDIVWGDGVDSDKLIAALRASTDSSLLGDNPATDETETNWNLFSNCNTAADVAAVFATFSDTSAAAASSGAIDAVATIIGEGNGILKGNGTSFSEGTGDDAKTYTASVTGDGYYFIKDVTTTLSDNNTKKSDTLSKYLLAVVKDTTIVAKDTGLAPDKEIVSGNERVKTGTAAIGDTVTFEVKIKVPDTRKYVDHFVFDMDDKLPGGLTFMEITSVKVGNDNVSYTLKSPASYTKPATTAAAAEATGGQEIKLVFNGFKAFAEEKNGRIGSDMVITYTAVVNKNADFTSTGNLNEVKFDYSNDPNHKYNGDEPGQGEPMGETPRDQTKTLLTNIELTKTGDNGSVTALEGAEFEITSDDYNITLVSGEKFDVDASANPAYYKLKDGSYTTTAPTTSTASSYDSTETKYKKTTFTDTVTTPGTSKKVTVITGSDGKISLKGLKAGTYTLKETKAPSGYNLDSTEYKIVLELDGTDKAIKLGNSSTAGVTFDRTSAKASITIDNKSGSELPSTGGIGTTIFYILGALLVVGCGIILIARRRSSANN